MSNEPGDRYLGHGDQDTRANQTGAQIDEGMWVVPTGDETVAKADVNGAGGSLVGVVGDDLPDGEKGQTHYRGVVHARVESDVAAGDELAAPDSSATSGATTPGVAGSGGTSGIYALEGAKDPEGNGEFYAKVLVR